MVVEVMVVYVLEKEGVGVEWWDTAAGQLRLEFPSIQSTSSELRVHKGHVGTE